MGLRSFVFWEFFFFYGDVYKTFVSVSLYMQIYKEPRQDMGEFHS